MKIREYIVLQDEDGFLNFGDELVRCKDCKFAQNNRYNSRVDGKCSVLCEHVTTEDGRYELKVFRNANDFCNYGKRREE